MSKRKLTTDEAVADFFRFVEDDDDEFYESDESDNDDLNEVLGDNNNLPLESDFDTDESDNDENQVQRPPRKQLTAKRLVNSIDKSLDETCYDRHDFGLVDDENDATVLTGYLCPKKNPRTEKIFWTNKAPNNTGRLRSYDILPRAPAPATLLAPASDIDSIADAFHCLFTPDMVELVVKHTNTKIQHVQDNLPEYYRLGNSTFVRPLNHQEFYAFVGLLYARGLLGQSMHHVRMLFSETCGHPVFSSVMSKHRFSFLLSVITFDDAEKRPEEWKTDRFAACREITNLFNDRMKTVLVPSEYLSIDETLYPMRHQIAFRQYNPNKPAKYGLLYKSLNDARFPFTYQTNPYCGKPVAGNGPYYLTATEEYIKTLVEAMPVNNMKGRNISMDRLYTSVSTAKWLLSRNITLVGTLQSNRIGLPDELKNPKERSEFESTIHWEKQHGNIALCTYTTKTKSKGMKNILVMSTMQPLLGLTKDDDKHKPAVIKFYDFTKGETDVMDMKMSKFSCKSLSHRWTMVHFYYLLDTIRCNALSLLAIKHDKSLKKVNSFDVGFELVMSLVKPFVAGRSINELSLTQQNKMSIILGRNVGTANDQPNHDGFEFTRFGSRQRCHTCLSKEHKKKKDYIK